MIKDKKNRREFIRDLTRAGAGFGILGLAGGCASFDDYLFDEKNDLDEEVVIIGGGIAGLYAAQQLRAKSIEFRLFEASPYFGGRIKSVGNRDYGANLLSQRDELVTKLIDELKIEKSFIDRDQYYIESGMGSVVDGLKQRVMGLLPYRNFRLRWKLIEIRKLTESYELTFQKPDGQTKVTCKKIIMTLPVTQLAAVRGVSDLPECKDLSDRLSKAKSEYAIRLILPLSSIANSSKSFQIFDFPEFKVRQLIKKSKSPTPVEIDVILSSNVNFTIDFIYQELKRKLQVNYPFSKLSNEQFFSWGKSSASAGAFYSTSAISEPIKSESLLFVGDSIASLTGSKIEYSLQSVKNALKTVI